MRERWVLDCYIQADGEWHTSQEIHQMLRMLQGNEEDTILPGPVQIKH